MFDRVCRRCYRRFLLEFSILQDKICLSSCYLRLDFHYWKRLLIQISWIILRNQAWWIYEVIFWLAYNINWLLTNFWLYILSLKIWFFFQITGNIQSYFHFIIYLNILLRNWVFVDLFLTIISWFHYLFVFIGIQVWRYTFF
jgi:hypothetical protein